MKYVILIHANPEPVGAPDLALHRGGAGPAGRVPRAGRSRVRPAAARRSRPRGAGDRGGAGRPGVRHALRLDREGHLATDGPYAETKEQLAGFFVIDVADPGARRGDRRAVRPPGRVVELRPACGPAATTSDSAAAAADPERRGAGARPDVLARAGPPLRRLRRGRGRRAGGAAGGAPAVAGRRACRQNPTGWLVTVASRRLVDQWRSDSARRRGRRWWRGGSARHPRPAPTSRGPTSATTRWRCCCCAATRRSTRPRRWPSRCGRSAG